ncbi:MAG: cysteine desulfurase [Methanobacteriota archaeon]|nr:MAG: cysteine desulfurase [Euryarchaeota archaeon]
MGANSNSTQKRIYMDYAAGSPVDARALEAMMPYFSDRFGNPSSMHSSGREPRKAVDDARAKVAELVNASRKEEIIFTAGGTEGNNLAVKGAAMRARKKGKHIVTSAIEHITIINVMKALQKDGFEVTTVPVNEDGIVEVGTVEEALREDTTVVSIMYANNEIGTLQPIDEIGSLLSDRSAVFHVDAVAAAGKVPINVRQSKIDLLTVSSNDLYGPKGVGAVFARDGVPLEAVVQGGGQERGLRSGSENTPGIVGFGVAAEAAKAEMGAESKRLSELRDKLIGGILDGVDDAFLNGHRTKRLPNNANFRFRYVEGESMLLNLDMMGVSVSSSSPCTSKSLQPSHVLLACGVPTEEAQSAIQLTLGKANAEDDVDRVIEILPPIVRKLREMSPFNPENLDEMRSSAGHRERHHDH